MKTQLNKQEKEKLSNKTVFFSSVTLLYALLLLFIQKMASSSLTVNGAVALISLLRWASLVGAMACAAWSAYKEKKGFFLYCALCIFIFWSTMVIHMVPDNLAYPINYCALFAAFILAQVYYTLKVRGKFSKPVVRRSFIGVCIGIIAILIAVCITKISLQTFLFWN